jgi:hypothetical protein
MPESFSIFPFNALSKGRVTHFVVEQWLEPAMMFWSIEFPRHYHPLLLDIARG